MSECMSVCYARRSVAQNVTFVCDVNKNLWLGWVYTRELSPCSPVSFFLCKVQGVGLSDRVYVCMRMKQPYIRVLSGDHLSFYLAAAWTSVARLAVLPPAHKKQMFILHPPVHFSK